MYKKENIKEFERINKLFFVKKHTQKMRLKHGNMHPKK
jgi:hypothetical protein